MSCSTCQKIRRVFGIRPAEQREAGGLFQEGLTGPQRTAHVLAALAVLSISVAFIWAAAKGAAGLAGLLLSWGLR